MGNNKYEKNNFRALIESDDIGRVEERLNIVDTFLDTEEHVTLEDLMTLLRERGFEYDSNFVKMCLNRWVDQGFAQKKTFEGQPPRYEHRHLGKHHDHLICTKCDKIVEFSNDEIEVLQEKIANELGFHILQHKMEIYGLCPQCLEKRSVLTPLSMAKPGEEIIIRDVTGGKEIKTRLTSMGFRVGDLLEVINNDSESRLIVAHGFTRLAIGRDLARNILVYLVPQKRHRPFLRGPHRHGRRKRRPFWKFR